jgi:endonuclease G
LATGTPNLKEAVDKARSRAGGLSEDLLALTERVRGSVPDTLGTHKQKQARRRFLESIYDEQREADQAFERIIGGNELQEANFLERGALVARAVLRIVIRGGGGSILGYGTGLLIGDGLLLTNNHVLPNSDRARASYAEAFYERDVEGGEAHVRTFDLRPDKLWFTSKPLDFSIVGVAETDRSGSFRVDQIGWIPLIGTLGKVIEGEWLTIVQHPRGERKQLCVRENQLLKCDTDVLWYSTDTLGGSSGSPVFNNDWLMVALHHSGVPATREGKWQTVDGRDYDPARDDESQIDWIANEGIRVSRILETLRTDNSIANHALLDPLLKTSIGDIQVRVPLQFAAGRRPPDLYAAARALTTSPAASAPPPKEARMTQRLVTVTLEIDAAGNVSLAGSESGRAEASFLETAGLGSLQKKKKKVIEAPVVPEEDWITGYDPDFLSVGDTPDPELRVNLPQVLQTAKIAPLKNQYGQTFTDEEKVKGVLRYNGYSVVMNKDRCLAFYSAANVDGSMRPTLSGRNDKWLFDDRISRDHQIDDSYYKNNKFDRGHLTRRDDMEWGASLVEATRRANGTCTWTNCAPQHEVFNQSKDKGILLWQNLERYILEETADARRMKVQVITGPIFGRSDPKFKDIAYPLEYWKVVAAVDAQGRLFATGYILGQKETIDKFGLEEAAVEVPFGAFGTYQRPISVIENVTGLEFTFGGADGGAARSLSEVDPLAATGWRPRRQRRAAGAQESFGDGGDDALGSFEDIVLA